MFLRKKDYYHLIQQANLNVVISSTDSLLQECELASQEEIESYLRHRYDTNKIFTDLNIFDLSRQYYTGNRVEWSESAWATTTTYAINNRVSYSGYIYVSLQNGNTGKIPSSQPTWWTQLSENESLWYAKKNTLNNLPTPEFTTTANNYTNNHKLVVGWDVANVTLYFKKYSDNSIKIYESEANRSAGYPTIGVTSYPEEGIDLPVLVDIISGDEKKLSGSFNIIGFIPDDTTWSISGTNYWSKGDNRNQQIKMYMVDITLYHIHSRINPRNIPEFRIQRRDDAIAWLKKIAKGEITADLPTYIDDNKGQEITYNSNVKLNHYY